MFSPTRSLLSLPGAVFARMLSRGECLFVAIVLLATARPASAVEIYGNDFQSGAGAGWSHAITEATPAPADGSRRFLGRFDNETVTLSLGGLAAHTSVTITCDMYAIGTWDGIDSSPYGPDRWTLGVEGGPILLDTSFSNVTTPPFGIPFAQNYPDAFGTAVHSQFTGAAESRTLGYIFSGYDVSAVYHLSYTFPHTGSSLAFDFTAAMGQGYGGPHDIEEESWGLDNVHVSTNAVAAVAPGAGSGVAFQISPNPTSTFCTVRMDRRASESVTGVAILDLSGRVVERPAIAPQGGGLLRFSLAALHPGIYFARVEGAKGVALGLGRIAVVR